MTDFAVVILGLFCTSMVTSETIEVYLNVHTDPIWNRYKVDTISIQNLENVQQESFNTTRIGCALTCRIVQPRNGCLGFHYNEETYKCSIYLGELQLPDNGEDEDVVESTTSTISYPPECPPLNTTERQSFLILRSSAENASLKPLLKLWNEKQDHIAVSPFALQDEKKHDDPDVEGQRFIYKSDDDWNAIRKVQVSMYLRRQKRAVVQFNITGSTKLNWMTQERVTCSSWQDMMDSSDGEFFLDGPSKGLHKRSFLMKKPNCGCNCTSGWMVVLDGSSEALASDAATELSQSCGLDQSATNSYPVFYFSNGTIASKFEEMVKADIFMIHGIM